MDKSPNMTGYTPRQVVKVGIGVIVLIAIAVFVLTNVAPQAEAAESASSIVAEQVADPHAISKEDLPSDVAAFSTSKKCDIYVTTADAGVWDWAVNKSKEFGCELRGLFTKEDELQSQTVH